MGGAPAAVEAYRQAPTPNVIVLEFDRRRRGAARAPRLASPRSATPAPRSSSSATSTTSSLYRELMRRGVSEYLIAPVGGARRHQGDLGPVLRAGRRAGRAHHRGRRRQGRRRLVDRRPQSRLGDRRASSSLSTVIADLDIAFGTAGLDFNQDPPQGIAEAVFAPERLDANLVDRLLSKCSDNLSLLAAPAMLDRTTDLVETALDGLFDILRASVPCIVLDVPHLWTAWVAPHADRRRRDRHRRGAGPRQPAQRQEPVRRPAPGAAERPQAQARAQPGRPAEAARDRGGRIRQGARDRNLRRRCPSMPSSSARRRTTAR